VTMLAGMSDPSVSVPAEIVALARQRAEAREARDWEAADELRARIERAGWKVVDAGKEFTLTPARPPDLVEDTRVLYGDPASVPARAGPAPDRAAAVLMCLPADVAATERCLAALRSAGLPGLDVVVVADASAHEREPTLDRIGSAAGARPMETGAPQPEPGSTASQPGTAAGSTGEALEVEVLWTSAPLGPAASLAAAAQRPRGGIIVTLEPPALTDAGLGERVAAELAARAVAALEDPRVAVAGFPGRRSADLHRFEPAGPGFVTAIGAGCLAFRHDDIARRDPRDERLQLAESVALWWSLLLRDEGPGAVPRRALALGLPVDGSDSLAGQPGVTRDRLARRDAYRITQRFGDRPELAWSEAGDPMA
jgi:hypothetical protein